MNSVYRDNYQRENYNVAIYCRLSNEDGEKAESNSIGNQKEMLTKHVEEKGWNIRNIYIDDGYSGLNFNRPAFKAMLEDIKNKEVSLVITKDMSRLGRDYIEVGYYIEKYFPENRIRFIALNDNIDTENDMGNNDITPFKAIINDMYSKDISRKVRSVLDAKRKAGQFIGSTAAYGYKKHPEDKNKLIVDDEASFIVKRIFAAYLSGKGYSAISRMLNAEGILPPAIYKRVNQSSDVYNKDKISIWSHGSVKAILINPVYKGSIAQNKYKKVNYKSQKIISLDKKEWIVVENTHEPIITAEEFYLTQELMQSKLQYYTNTPKNLTRLFSGLAICGDCGGVMTYSKTPSGYDYLICSTYKRHGKDYCTRHSIKEEELEKTILHHVRALTIEHADKEMLKEEAKKLAISKNLNKNKYQMELNLITKRLKEIDRIVVKLYEEKAMGIIEDKKYLILDQGFDYEKNNITKRAHDIVQKLEENYKQEYEEDRIKKIVKMATNIEKLNSLILNQLVEHIEVFENKRIHITYKFKDLS